MPGPLLETKLHTPRTRRALLPRPRLDALMDRTWGATVTLVAAPAGFGKTTLLADWSARVPDGRCAAWLSLDERDSDPSSFWTYAISALRTVAPGVGTAALHLLRTSQDATYSLLESLINDLQALDAPLVLVLDDYHLVQAAEVQDGMAFLLEHLPRQVHVVLATRADPPLPLARLRARGELVEVRAGDLRFTAEEAAGYLRDAMGVVLDQEQVDALDQRTEGWIAALQLAALSMQSHPDVSDFITTFTGNDRYIVDYLVEEVLQRQAEPVRRFLLDTSILSRMTGSLCDAVTGEGDGRATLELLDRQNLFVIPLDNQRHWYRYHHLFADVLRARLLDEQPQRVQLLHRRASEWYAEHDEPAGAVDHAVHGEDFAFAAQLVEQALPTMRRERRDGELRRWLEALPDQLVRRSPALMMGLVGALMAQGELDGVESRLQDAERWLDSHGGEAAAIDGTLRTLASSIAMYRAGQARLHGDVEATIRFVERVHQLAGDGDYRERGAAAALLGLAQWSKGQLDEAHCCYSEALENLRQAGHLPDVLGCSLALSDIEIARGRLDAAATLLHEGLSAARGAAHLPRGTADMHVGLAAVHVERNELEAALQHLAASDELGEHLGLPQNAYRSRVVRALALLAKHAADDAFALLEDAQLVYNSDYSPDVRPIPALLARSRIAQGRTDAAQDWVRARGLAVQDELSYVREFEHLTLARVLLAQAEARDVRATGQLGEFLDRLQHAAEQGGRPGSALEVLVLKARLAQLLGDVPQAQVALAEAVRRAAPQRYVWTIMEHGAPVIELLHTLPTHTAGGYARRLLQSVDDRAGAIVIPRQALRDPLSARELEVLRLLSTDLTGPDIARQLVVSVHTVRTHTKSIYAKLGVGSRRAAVSRAGQLGLLAHGR